MRVPVITILTFACVLAGCTGAPFRWAATEQQIQAADLAVQDAQALTAHVRPAGRPVLAELHAAARTAQTYFGLPAQPLTPGDPGNAAVIGQAASDAAAAPPATAEVLADSIERATETGFRLLDLVLATGAGIAATWGAGKAAGRINDLRGRAADAQTNLQTTGQALREVVQGIEELTPEIKAAVKDAQRQSTETQALVARIKASA